VPDVPAGGTNAGGILDALSARNVRWLGLDFAVCMSPPYDIVAESKRGLKFSGDLSKLLRVVRNTTSARRCAGARRTEDWPVSEARQERRFDYVASLVDNRALDSQRAPLIAS
jgi:hypothetical protein